MAAIAKVAVAGKKGLYVLRLLGSDRVAGTSKKPRIMTFKEATDILETPVTCKRTGSGKPDPNPK